MVVLPDRKDMYVGDGDGSVKVIDLITNTTISKIVTGGTKRADMNWPTIPQLAP